MTLDDYKRRRPDDADMDIPSDIGASTYFLDHIMENLKPSEIDEPPEEDDEVDA